MSNSILHRRRKRRAPWAAYLWPGLPHLWVRGSWAGLALAVAFTALLHTTVLATLVWPQWLSPRVVTGCGVTLGLLWLAALWETRGELKRLAAEREADLAAEQSADESAGEDQTTAETASTANDPLDELFTDAQTYYLRADWVATERTLLELLKQDNEDIEAQLLLATLWRRTDRIGDARRRLRWLARREAAEPWRFEIEAEQALCDAAALDEVPPTRQDDPSTNEMAPIETPVDSPLPTEPRAESQNEGPAQSVDPAQPQPLRTDRKAA